MLRNTLFGLSMLALTTGSAFAATSKTAAVKHPTHKAPVVAQAKTDAPADGAATAKTAKKSTKKSKKSTKTDAAKGDGAKEMKAAPPAAN